MPLFGTTSIIEISDDDPNEPGVAVELGGVVIIVEIPPSEQMKISLPSLMNQLVKVHYKGVVNCHLSTRYQLLDKSL